MASREELLQSIQPDKAFFMKVYGYEISFPCFSDEAIKFLSDAGCSRAREYYNKAVSEYESRRDVELKEAAHWYRLECEREWEKRQKEGDRQWKQEQENLQQMSDSDLIMLLENLIGAI